MNPWHDVPIGKDSPKIVSLIVEIPQGSRNRYELEKETGLMILDRVLYSPVQYPADYGFIPQTYWEDGDPLDALVIGRFPIFPNTIVKVRPIALIQMIDEGEDDSKIICVPAADPHFEHYTDKNDISDHFLRELKHFFEIYKHLQGKKVKVLNFLGKKDAEKTIIKAKEKYKKEILKITASKTTAKKSKTQ